MTDQNANVVLTADTSGYTQSLQQAQSQTDRLTSAVDTLASHLDGLTKRAGKKLVLFGAADLAAMTGAVALASKYEQQTKTLSAALDKGQGSLKQYTLSIDEMARRIPAARGEIAALYTQLVQLGVKGPDATTRMADSMLKLSAVTGESVGGLTDNLITLNKQMNTMATGSGAVSKFSDSLYAVSKSAGVSATGVLAFAQNLAPFARAAGIGEKSLMGISAAFNAAGADGYAAANTFNSMIADITRSIQNGSPDISKYSNLIGVTVDQFKKMDATDRITAIFDAINAQGPKAIRTLDQLGYDGIRAAKAIQGVAQSGNMRAMIAEANAQYGSGAASSTAENDTWAGLDSQMKRISNSLQQVGANIGSALLPPATAVARVFANILDTVNSLGAPIMKIGGAMAGFTGAAAMGIGGLMTALGPLSNLAMGAYVFRSRPVRGLLGGFMGGLHEGSTGMAPTTGMGAKMADQYAAGLMPWYQRRVYEASRGFGLALGGPNLGGANYLGRVLSTPFRAATWFARGTEDFYKDSLINGEDRFLGPLSGRQRFLVNAYRDARITGATAEQRRLFRGNVEGSIARFRAGAIDEATLKAEIAAHKKVAEAAIRAAGTLDQVTVSAKEVAGAMMSAAGANLRAGVGNIGGMLGKAGGMLGSLIGGVPGMVMMGGMLAYGAYSGAQEAHNAATPEGSQNPISDYNAKLGLATNNLTRFSDTLNKATQDYSSSAQALNDLTAANAKAAANGSVTSTVLGSMDNNPAGGLAFLRGVSGGLTPQNANEVTADLIRKYGYTGAQQILKQYGTGTQFGVNDVSALASSADMQNSGPMRFLHGGVTDAGNTVSGDIGGAINQTVAGIAGSNRQRAGQVNSSLAMSSLTRIAAMAARGEISDPTASQAVKNLEQTVFGHELNYSTSAWSAAAASYTGKTEGELTDEDFSKWLKHVQESGNAEGNNFAPDMSKWINSQKQAGYNPFMSVNQAYTTGANPNDPVTKAIQGTLLGRLSTTNGAVSYALGQGLGSDKAQYAAVQQMLGYVVSTQTGAGGMNGGGSINRSVQAFDSLISAINLSSDRLSQLGTAALQAYQGLMKYKSGDLSAQGAVMQDLNIQGAILRQPQTQSNPEAQNTARQQQAADLASVRDYYKQYATMLMQFQKQKTRAEEDYTLQTSRATESFQRQQEYSEKDYYRQRLWNQEDFNRTMQRNAEDAAKSVYNPWQRVYSQLTSGAANMRDNLAEQNDELAKQVANLKKAHQLGLSENTIRTLDLANPQNAQQLDALIQDMIANPAFVRQINEQTARRLALSRALTQNTDNSAYARAVEDFRRGQQRNDTLFHQSMARARREFGISMAQMAADHKTAMDRAAQDLSDYNKTANGDFTVLQGIVHKFQKDLGIANGYIKDMDAFLAQHPWLIEAMRASGTFGLDGGGTTPSSNGRRGENGGPGFASPSATTSTSRATSPMALPPEMRVSTSTSSVANSNNRTTVNVHNNYYTKTGPVVANNPTAIYNAINAQNKINALTGKKSNAFF